MEQPIKTITVVIYAANHNLLIYLGREMELEFELVCHDVCTVLYMVGAHMSTTVQYSCITAYYKEDSESLELLREDGRRVLPFPWFGQIHDYFYDAIRVEAEG